MNTIAKSILQALLSLLCCPIMTYAIIPFNKCPQRCVSNKSIISIVQGDITKQKDLDAIVNAANFQYLPHPGGIAAAIKKAAGLQWDAEWKKATTQSSFGDGLHQTRAILTNAHDLKKNNNVSYIINAVGPQGTDPYWREKLKKTYTDALMVAHENKLTSIAFPAISTGIFAQDASGKTVITQDIAATIAIKTTEEFLKNHPTSSLQDIRFVVWDEAQVTAYSQAYDCK